MNSISIPYPAPTGPTSTASRRTRWLLVAVWAVMFVQGLVFVDRYALTNPYVDEWEFMGVLLGDEPAIPWLWELHNEHRFPLPRVVYLALFRLTGDLRAGCVVSLVGMSLLAAGLIRLAARLRGWSRLEDAFFPLLLMHSGQSENLYMGYQMCFMLTAVLAGGLLAVMMTTGSHNKFRHGVYAGALGLLSMLSGAAGLAFGCCAAAWLVALACSSGLSWRRRLVIFAIAAVTPAYLIAYRDGYVRPDHHPPSAGIVESGRVGLQAQSMAFGPAATGIWPAAGAVAALAGFIVVGQLGWAAIRRPADRLRDSGLLLFVGAATAVAFGIGWGRSGFHADMGFAWRYGWIVAPAVTAAYFGWLTRGGRWAVIGPMALFAVTLVTAPINCISGFREGEFSILPIETWWAADVRAGLTAEQVLEKYDPACGGPFKERVLAAMRLMRARHYSYYDSLGEDPP